MTNKRLQFIDIGLNLSDDMFNGFYKSSKQYHKPDIKNVIERANNVGVTSAILTSGNFDDIQNNISLISNYSQFYFTAGLHPTRSNEYNENFIAFLNNFIETNKLSSEDIDGKVVAVGECGLDYDRLHFADKDIQKISFTHQLKLAYQHNLPLFLHSRAAHIDFVDVIRNVSKDFGNVLPKGVVHSFTGTLDEMNELVQLGFYIGLNGCSLKTQDNLDVASKVPLDRLMVETDAPWCSVSSTHASFPYLDTLNNDYKLPVSVKKEKWEEGKPIKSRNEPGFTPAIVHILSQVMKSDFETVANAAFNNTKALFNI